MWSNIVPIFVTLSRTSYCKKKKTARSSALQLKKMLPHAVQFGPPQSIAVSPWFKIPSSQVSQCNTYFVWLFVLIKKIPTYTKSSCYIFFFLSSFSFLGNILIKENWCNQEIWLVHNFLKTLIHVRRYITNKGINERSRCMKF